MSDGLGEFVDSCLAESSEAAKLISEHYVRRGDEMVLVEQTVMPALRGLLEIRAAIRGSVIQHEIDTRIGDPFGLEGRPVTVGLAEAARFKHYVGLSPARARKLHRTEGFPLRVRGTGARRSYYVVLAEAEAWWKKNPTE